MHLQVMAEVAEKRINSMKVALHRNAEKIGKLNETVLCIPAYAKT